MFDFWKRIWSKSEVLTKKKLYYKSGKLKSKLEYKGDKLHGVIRHYYKNGKIKQMTYYIDGKKDGIDINYNKKGEVYLEALFSNDRLVTVLYSKYELPSQKCN